MEDFSLPRVSESGNTKASPLLAEWHETQHAAKFDRTEISLAVTKLDDGGPGKDVADRLDRELRAFVDEKDSNASADMQAFRKMIGKFSDSADKKSAMDDLGDSYSRLRVQMEKDAIATYDEMEAEGAKQPGRAALSADYSDKLGKFFDKVDASSNVGQILNTLEWKDGETKSTHRARVQEELKGDKPLLNAYNEMEDASDKVDANMSPREKQLAALHDQQLKDHRVMQGVVNKAYIRSTINF